jgi:hypothetical protein
MSRWRFIRVWRCLAVAEQRRLKCIGLVLTVGGHAVVTRSIFAALVVMVIVTTLITPPLLAWRLRRLDAIRPAPPGL